MFKLDDRVTLTEDFCTDYNKGDVCTVKMLSGDYIGVLSDTDDDDRSYLYVLPEKLAHITNEAPAEETKVVRTFGTGATRDLDVNKLDFEGFLSPLVLKRYAEHMHKARKLPDGSLRASDNWQLGIPKDAYMKSMFRHFFDVWSPIAGSTRGSTSRPSCARCCST
jgi:hypothetical protein